MCLFNWNETVLRLPVKLPRAGNLTDYWTGESMGRREGTITIEMAPRSARLLKLS